MVWDAATGALLASIPVPASSGVSVHLDGWRCAVGSIYTGTWIVDARPLTPALRSKRDAHNLVAHLVRKPLLKDEILDQLGKMKTIGEPVRREAVALAAGLESPSNLLVYAAEEKLMYSDRSPDEYRRALRWLEEANLVSPNDGAVLNLLGIALYRLGRFAEAVPILEKAFEINMSGNLSPPAGDLIFLAMAQHRLGRKEEARKTLVRARGPLPEDSISPHYWREAEALIGGKED
jgi:tetratricopeptide (TPR) repeat protein